MTNDPSDDPSQPDWSALEFDPSSFSGVARLFPLPAPSLYPRVVQPLHIFEERYRELMRDALAGDGLIAMTVLRPGWETDYASRPPLEAIGCLGSIVTHHRLEDGRYNLLLAGVARVRLLDEIEPPLAFRRARVELLSEAEPPATDALAAALRSRLISAFRAALPTEQTPDALRELLEGDTPLGLLADLAAYALPLPRDAKQAALAELDAATRAADLLAALGAPLGDRSAPPRGFPPPFSAN
ncbi:LON peptidase substrate-binding domain-containing protein [Botrimarina sp.]|uniref:LON peptidase substrate-binding domain-containing protein n=1 Tax=Botrimarina sp. TaxID=2795802 RepID=UPI0032EC8ECA